MHIQPVRPDSPPRRVISASIPDVAQAPAKVVSQFSSLTVNERARVLGRLLSSVGPLALAVVGDGAFAKYVRLSRLPEIPVSFEDAARTTVSQISDLVRYVQQSDPQVFTRLFGASETPAPAH